MKTQTIRTSLLTLAILGLLFLVEGLVKIASAQPSPAPVPVTVADTTTALQPFIDAFTAKFGWLVAVVLWVGTARLVIKPAMTFMHAVADATPTTKDNEIVDKIEHSKAYTTFLFVIDWIASIKVKKPSL